MTKDEILNMLRSASAPISGEEMSRALGVSRAAVWKAVDQLRQEGYAIEAATRRGYRLAALPDRLDAAVSGLMVYARSAKAASLLSEQLRSRTFGKEYLAVVHGVPEGGVMTDLLGRDPVRRRTYVAAEPGKNVRPAELSYEVLGSREGLSLVRIRLHTGRTHQIRVQFASRGFPLAGDRKYGGGEEGESIALWSWRLEFTHPQTGAAMRFSKLPPKETPWLGFPMPLTGR